MLKELVNYANWLKKDFPEIFEYGVVNKGLHIKITLDINGNRIGSKYEYFAERSMPSKFVLEMAKIENSSEMIPVYVSKNKYVDSSSKFIISNNCFSLFFYFFKDDKRKGIKLNDAFAFLNKNSNQIKKDNLEDFIKTHTLFIEQRKKNKKVILKDEYFKNLKDINNCDICNNCNKCNCPLKKYIDSNKFKRDLKEIFEKTFIEKKDGNMFLKYKKEIKNLMVYIILDMNDSFSTNMDKQIKNYFLKRLPLKHDKAKDPGVRGDYIFSPILNQDNDAKIFSRHKTAFSEKNIWIKMNEGKELIKLLKLLYNHKLPNPLPIFIDKDELNERVITIFKDNNKRSYKEIIRDLVANYSKDLNNYYLINYSKQKSLTISDFDYVSSFSFRLSNNKVYKIKSSDCKINNMRITDKIENVFDIEDKLNENFLFKVNRKTGEETGILKYNYFTDRIKQKGNEIPSFVLNNIYKYRKTLYDAIYKSRLYLITPQMIKEICEPTILYEIYHDKTDEKENNENDRRIIKSKNEYLIIKKLISYFNLNRIFDKENKNTGGIDMPSKLPEYYSNLKELLEETFDLNNTNNVVFKSDEDFAFSLGQLIKYLLEQSESSNKNHSMLVPFLQKLNSYDLFMNQLVRTFKSYSYKIKMHYRMFDRLMANVMGYKLEDKKLKDLEMVILSGYFADSVIRESMKERNTKSTNDEKENTKEEKK